MRKLLTKALEFESALNLHLNLCPNMTTSNASQPQVYMSADDSFEAAIFAITVLRTEEILFPALQETHVLEDVLTVQEGHIHQIPGPPKTTSESGDPANEQLLEAEQQDVEAARLLLKQVILNNSISIQHYWRILTSLRDKLLDLPPHEIPHGDAYARILLRMADRLMRFPMENCEFFSEDNVLHFRRCNYDACLGELLHEMAQGFVWMQQAGTEDEVYVRNKERHTEYLHYLASRLSGAY